MHLQRLSVRFSSRQELTERSIEPPVPLSGHESSQEPTVQLDSQRLHLSTTHFQTVHRQTDCLEDGGNLTRHSSGVVPRTSHHSQVVNIGVVSHKSQPIAQADHRARPSISERDNPTQQTGTLTQGLCNLLTYPQTPGETHRQRPRQRIHHPQPDARHCSLSNPPSSAPPQTSRENLAFPSDGRRACPSQRPAPSPISSVSNSNLARPSAVTRWKCGGRLNQKFDRRQSKIILIFFRSFFQTKKGVVSSRRQVRTRTRCLDLSSSMKPTYSTRSCLNVGSPCKLNPGSTRLYLASTGSRNIWTLPPPSTACKPHNRRR